MPIIIPDGFAIGNKAPVDKRIVAANSAIRKVLSTNNVYNGLLVFQEDNNKLYKLINATAPLADASWLEVGGISTVNGTSPDSNGNVAVSIAATYTGFSSSLSGAPSLQASASGPITASFPNGALWIVTGETNAARTGSNGETFIFSSGSVGQWTFVPNYSQNAADARYLVKSAGGTVSGNVTLDNGAKLVGTASWAESASFANTAININGGSPYSVPLWNTSTTLTRSIIYQDVAGGNNNIGIGTLLPSYKLDVKGDIATSTGSLYVSSSIIYYGPFGNTDPGDNPLKIIQKSGWNADPGIVIGALNTIYTASSGVTVGGSNESYARGGANWIIGSSNYVTSSIYVVNNNYIFGYGNKVSGSSLTAYGGGAGNQVLIGRENISDMSTNGQAACILIGAFNNTNGYRGGGMYGSRLKYYANNQLAFGHNSSNVDFAIKDVFFGMGVRNEYTSVLSNNGLEGNGVNISINPSWAADEANRNAGSLNLNGGRGTGTGSAGDVIFATATTGSTGATLHSLTNRVWVKGHTGNVGIGTSTPSGSLHVSGTVYFSNLVTSSVALTNVLMISSSGQIFTTASSAIGGGGSPFTLTSGNGTTANGTAVDLGGTLTGNTDIDGNYKVSFGATTPLLQFNVAAGNNTLGMDSAGVGFGANLVALVGSNLIRMTGPTQVTGSLNTTGSVLFRGLTTSNQSNVVTIDTTTGQLYYTASSAIGGGGTGTGFPFSGNALITGSLLISGSGLTITGSVNISGSLNATASWAQSASNAVNAQTASYVLASNIVGSLTRIATGSVSASVNVATSSIFQLTSGSNTILNISNKGNTTLIGSGSATPILAVSGSQGDLFSVSDSLSGSLFAVNDTDGLPVLEAFSDGTVTIGSQTRPAIYTSVETVINSGTGQILYQIPTASCFGLFFDTIVKSGSQYSVGNAATVINSNTTDTAWYDSTPTNGASIDKFFGIIITGSYLAITGSSTPQSSTFRTDGWITRLIIRAI